jgi:hypothetical protein
MYYNKDSKVCSMRYLSSSGGFRDRSYDSDQIQALGCRWRYLKGLLLFPRLCISSGRLPQAEVLSVLQEEAGKAFSARYKNILYGPYYLIRPLKKLFDQPWRKLAMKYFGGRHFLYHAWVMKTAISMTDSIPIGAYLSSFLSRRLAL